MGKRGKSLSEGIKEDYSQRERGQAQAQLIQLAGGEKEEGRGSRDEGPGEAAAEQSGGQMAAPGARIARVYVLIHQAVEGHGGGAGADHRGDNPGQLSPDAGATESGVAKCQQSPRQ